MKTFIIFILTASIFGCMGYQGIRHYPVLKKDIKFDAEDFFSRQRFGANFFNEEETLERMMAAKRLGLSFIRLTPSKWKSTRPDAKLGEFLISDRHHYQGLFQKDVEALTKVLDLAQFAGLKVVLTFLNIPGRMWRQHNNGQIDCRLWTDENFHDEAAEFFADLTVSVLKHPAIAAINPVNEPEPQHCGPKVSDWVDKVTYAAWQKENQNTASDLNVLYRKIHENIRKFHRTIPIILSPGDYGSAAALPYLTPFADPNVLYSMHMYEPFFYTYQRRPNLTYPGLVPTGEAGAITQRWDKNAIKGYLEPIKRWQRQHDIPNNRILVGEFGVDRTASGARQYLADVLDIFNENGWSWALYTFRETAFTKFDYEIGPGKPGWKYWQAVEAGHDPNFRLFKSNELIETILSKMGPKRPAIRPAMGFNSWNWFGRNIDEKIIEETILAMDRQGLTVAGYEYVVIDGGWAADQLDKEGLLMPHPEKFPRGIKRLSDLAHAHGLKLGIHISAGTHNCGGKPIGSLGKEKRHLTQLNQWHIDFIKLDQCMLNGSEDWPEYVQRATVKTWHEMLAKNSRPITLSMSNYKFYDWYPQFGAFGRTTMDLRPKVFGGATYDQDYTGAFLSIMEAASINNSHHSKAGGSYWNDPDMLVVGDPNLSKHQQITHFALWAIMSAPLMLGLDVRNLNDETKRLISNRELISIDQDTYQQGYRLRKTADLEIWRKFLTNGNAAILVINLHHQKPQTAVIMDYEAEMADKFSVRDVFNNKPIGRFTKQFKIEVGPQQSKLLLFRQ